MTIELVHGCVHDNHSTTKSKDDNHTAVISACMVELQAEQPEKNINTHRQHLSHLFQRSPKARSIEETLSRILTESKAKRSTWGSSASIQMSGRYATSFFTQLNLLSKRIVVNNLRNPPASVVQFVNAIFLALLIGVVFLNLKDDYPGGLQNRVGAFFFITLSQIYANISAVELFISERVLFMHESGRGFYRVSAYFFSKILCDLIPLRLVPVVPFALITYFMMGLRLDVVRFLIYFLTLFLTSFSGTVICFFISASVHTLAIGNLFIGLCFVLMSVFGGLLVNISSLPDWIQWVQYLSIVRYSQNAFCINELDGMTFHEYDNSSIVDSVTGEYYLAKQGISYETAWDFWQNIVGLGVYTVLFIFLSYVQLRRIKTRK